MGKMARDEARTDHGPAIASEREVDGYAINFVTFKQKVDHAPLLASLPDGRCQCPHWGYVIQGRMTWRYADHEEVYEAGDAFYAPAGHVPVAEAGTELVQFSPAEQRKASSEAIMAAVEEMQHQGAPS